MERTVTIRTALEAILVEQALAMARELEAVTDAAPDGAVLAVGEVAAVRLGRALTRVALQAALQRQAADAEKKGTRPRLPLRRASLDQGPGGQDDRDRRRAGGVVASIPCSAPVAA